MDLHSLQVVHVLPLWFLVFGLFLPRIALLLLWLQNALVPFHVQGIVALVIGVLLPRALIIYLIYLDQGLSTWFFIHLVVGLLVWGGSGGYRVRQRGRRREYDYRQLS